MPAQLAQRELAQRVRRHRADRRHRMPEVGQRDTDIGFRATGVDHQLWLLQQQLTAGRAHAQQQLSETDNTTHGPGSL
ncbi:hypothetical protein D3C71_1632480 [compost metagenome]